MTKLRAIKPVNMRGADAGTVSTDLPEFDWLDPSLLFVEDDYQRGLSDKSLRMIRRIAANWNWAKIKPAICVRSGNRIVIIDGQHTALAAVSHGGIAKIPVMIVDAKTIKERADAFISQNRDRLALTPMHLHYAAVAAGDEIAVAVDQACKKAKVTILRAPKGAIAKHQVGETVSVGIISRIVAKVGIHHGARVLKVLVDAKRAPIAAHEVAAVYELLFDPKYRSKVDAFDLVTVVRSKPMETWRADAWRLVASTGMPRRQALAAAWFRALNRSKRDG